MTRPKIKSFTFITGKKYDGIMRRCYSDKDSSYKSYGARGVRVCTAWIQDIENFRAWVRQQLTILGVSEQEFVNNSKRYQVDRITNAGHYTPDNCRLVSPQENSRNKPGQRREFLSAEGVLIAV